MMRGCVSCHVEEMATEEGTCGRRRPGKLNPAVSSYYRRVGDILDHQDFESDEERSLFVTNVFAELEGNVLKVCRDKVVSCIVEKLLRSATTPLLTNFLSQTKEKLNKFVCDKYASHVLQTALMLCLPMIRNEAVGEVVLPICQKILSKVDTFLFDLYGSHVVRVVIQLLSGVRVGESVTRSRVSRFVAEKKVGRAGDFINSSELVVASLPTDFKKQFKALFKVLVALPEFSRILCHGKASPVLQTLLVASHRRLPKRCEKLCLQALTSARVDLKSQDDGDGAGTAAFCLATDSVGSHTIETILTVCSSDLHQQFFCRCFKKRLFEMAMHSTANFVLQRLLETSHEKEEVSWMVTELSPQLEDVLATGHAGVVVALVQACAQSNVQQKAVFEALLHAFHARTHPKLCIRAFLSLRTLDSLVDCEDSNNIESALMEKAVEIHYHGAQLVQALLSFFEPDCVVKSLLEISPPHLLQLASNASGSHVLEAFLNCQTAREKRKRKLVRLLQGQFVQLACDKFGSHVVDACWRISSLEFKPVIANELLSQESVLRSNCFGRHVLVNCAIEEFKHKRHVWDEHQKASQKRKSALADFLKDIDADTAQVPCAKRRKPHLVSGSAQDSSLDPFLSVLGFPAEDEDEAPLADSVERTSSSSEFHQWDKNGINADEHIQGVLDPITKTKKLKRKKH